VKEQKVGIYYRCKTPEGWKYFPAALNKLKKVRPRYAQVGDKQILYPVGHYELKYYVDRKPVFKVAGEDATEAQRLQQEMMGRLTTGKMAVEHGVVLAPEGGRIHLRTRADEYILRQKTRGKKRMVKMLTVQLPEFLKATGVTYADELKELHILRYYDHLQKRGNKQYTIHNKHVNVFSFLKWAGVERKPLAPNGQPKLVKRVVQVYKLEELDAFFASIRKAYHRLVFQVLLKTGMREQEAAHLEWHNFDFENNTVTVLWKPEMGFDIKDSAERTIPLDLDLKAELLAWRKAHPDTRYVLGNTLDKPNGEWLPMLKRIVRSAGLNCGKCATCLDENKKQWTKEKGGCERWTLKKFRSTYTTTMLRNGVDPRTLMEWTGHESLETIMLYMAPAEGDDVRRVVDNVQWSRKPRIHAVV
jgi:integrase